MKKRLRFIALILVIVIFSSLLVSCSSESLERLTGMVMALSLESQAGANLAAADSYTAKTKMTITYQTASNNVRYTATGVDMVSGALSDSPLYCNTYDYETMLLIGQVVQGRQQYLVERGYIDGEAYIYMTVEGAVQMRAKSELTLEEYLDFVNGNSDDSDDGDGVSMAFATGAAKRREGGGWSVKFTDLDEESLENLTELYSLDSLLPGLKIENIVYSAEIGADMMYESVSMVFMLSDDTATMKIDTVYSDINSTTFKPRKITYFDTHDDVRELLP